MFILINGGGNFVYSIQIEKWCQGKFRGIQKVKQAVDKELDRQSTGRFLQLEIGKID
jgi:hypothetical protein